VTTLADRLRAALDAEEAWARAASQTREPGTPTGEHWRWECNECDTPITINPVTDAYVECPNQCSAQVSLRSVEEYPTGMSYTLSAFLVSYAEEVPATAGMLIVRHDPASVLRMVAAHRKIVDAYEVADRYAGEGISPEGMYANGLEFAVLALAEAYGVEA
jgi:hypothetical protein